MSDNILINVTETPTSVAISITDVVGVSATISESPIVVGVDITTSPVTVGVDITELPNSILVAVDEGLPEAPIDTILYGRKDGEWVIAKAIRIPITDAGGFYTGINVELALQEVGDGTTLDGRYVNVTGGIVTGDLNIYGIFTNYNSSLQDMGKEITSDKRGYGLDYITDKQLSNVLIGGNARIDNGGIRVDIENDPDTFEIYLRAGWQTIIYDLTTDDGDFRHAPISEEIYVWRGDSVLLGLNGQPSIQEYGASMGAYPSYPIINGGTF